MVSVEMAFVYTARVSVCVSVCVCLHVSQGARHGMEMRFVPWQSPRRAVFPNSMSCSYPVLKREQRGDSGINQMLQTFIILFSHLAIFAIHIEA